MEHAIYIGEVEVAGRGETGNKCQDPPRQTQLQERLLSLSEMIREAMQSGQVFIIDAEQPSAQPMLF